ncbi:conserved hypothetical protein [Trichinella spiralis]|uniref:hypothetical protein n=1 Tax=Trichinella spiralis TaxID=6334 RepID=UPI0001EFE2C2|nr:conserved hypothetical protein [Trichinella spiralis]
MFSSKSGLFLWQKQFLKSFFFVGWLVGSLVIFWLVNWSIGQSVGGRVGWSTGQQQQLQQQQQQQQQHWHLAFLAFNQQQLGAFRASASRTATMAQALLPLFSLFHPTDSSSFSTTN